MEYYSIQMQYLKQLETIKTINIVTELEQNPHTNISPDRGLISSTTPLYQIEGQLVNLLEQIADNDGEMSEEQEALHKELIESFNKKGSAYGAVIANLNNNIVSIDSEIERLQKRKVSIENNIKRIYYILQPAIERWGVEKVTPTGIIKYILKFPLYTFEVVKKDKTELSDIEDIPNEFKRYQVQLDRQTFEKLSNENYTLVVKKTDCLKTEIQDKITSLNK